LGVFLVAAQKLTFGSPDIKIVGDEKPDFSGVQLSK